jgi:hypothetical protein
MLYGKVVADIWEGGREARLESERGTLLEMPTLWKSYEPKHAKQIFT